MIITEYIQKAIKLSQVEKMEDGRFFAAIPGFQGLWADGPNKKQCLIELHRSMEEWLVTAPMPSG